VLPSQIIKFLDARPDLQALVAAFVDPKPLWAMFLNRSEVKS